MVKVLAASAFRDRRIDRIRRMVEKQEETHWEILLENVRWESNVKPRMRSDVTGVMKSSHTRRGLVGIEHRRRLEQRQITLVLDALRSSRLAESQILRLFKQVEKEDSRREMSA